MKERPELVDESVGVLYTHLSHAVELYFHAVATSSTHEPRWSWILSRRHSLSAIVHAYCALESAVSWVSHDLFFDDTSPRRVADDKRDIPLQRMLKAWTVNVPLVDKIAVVLSHLEAEGLPARLTNELRELRTLRNWILHGFSFKSTMLIEPIGDDHFAIVDREDSFQWQKEFPNTKFSRLDDLNSMDARTALRIVLQTLQHLAQATQSEYMGIAYFDEPYIFHIKPGTDIVDRILDMKRPEDPTTDSTVPSETAPSDGQ